MVMFNKDKKFNLQQIVILSMLSVIAVLLTVLVVNNKFSDKNVSRTVMIYLVGSNLESEHGIASKDLESLDTSKVDFENMNILVYAGGTEKWHNFMSNDENAIYEFTSNGFVKKKSYEKVNMGDPETLLSLLNYGYDNYKTDKYDLIFYNHGGAIDGAIYDDFSSDNLSVEEFRDAMSKSQFNSNNKLETVLFRTCLNGTLEVSAAFCDYADYMIASEEVTNGAPTASVLNFLNDVSDEDSAVDYGKKFISAYDSQQKKIDLLGKIPAMYSVIDLSKIKNVFMELNNFVKSIDLENNYSDIVRLRSNMYQYAYSNYLIGDYDTVDLYTLMEQLGNYSSKKADDVLKAIENSVVYNWSNVEGSHGISIYFPYRGSSSVQNKFLSEYSGMNDSTEYVSFIKKFNSLSTSKKVSSFKNFAGSNLEKKEPTSLEFSLELSDEHVSDYARSQYIVFEKEENGMYAPIFYSDDTKLDGNKIVTNISNKLIKAYDKSVPDDKGEFLRIFETEIDGEKVYRTNAVVMDFDTDEGFIGYSAAVKAFFDFNGDEPFISHMVELDTELGAGGNLVDMSLLDNIDFARSEYHILDENGNYTTNWDNEGVLTMVELNPNNMEFKKASLEESDYYCVFQVYDIYGNYYYSNLVSINN